jgi:hypothetical protein
MTTAWLITVLALSWVLAWSWIVQDAMAFFPRPTVLWWATLALLLGPIGLPFYLSERMRRRAEFNKIGHGKAAVPVLDPRRVFRTAGMRRYTDIQPPGSGIFVVVGEDSQAAVEAEIPARGSLVVRRAVGNERSRPGVLILHDDAVSRQEHCRLSFQDGRLRLEDRSRWGTIVDGERVRHTVQQITIASVLRVGKTVLRFR